MIQPLSIAVAQPRGVVHDVLSYAVTHAVTHAGGRSGIWSADCELIAEAGAAPDEVARAVFVESEPERLRKSRPASRGSASGVGTGARGSAVPSS